MELDPFLIAAQAVNFLILVWLLHRFLFAPVTRVMDERAARVQAELDEARDARRQAEERQAEVEKQLEGLSAERETVLAEAREQADDLKARLVADVREQVEQLRDHWREGMLREREGFLERLQDRVLDHTHRAMRRALADLADDDLDAHVVRSFLDRLDTLDESQWQELVDVAAPHHDPHRKKGKKKTTPRGAPGAGETGERGTGEHARPTGPVFDVTAARDLPDDVRRRITDAVHRHAPDATLRFHTDPRPGCGVELRGPGRKLAWSLDDYLGSLRAAVQEVFEQLIGSRR